MEVRLSKRELFNDDLVALSVDVVLVEKTVRMANLSKRELHSWRQVAATGTGPPPTPPRAPPSQVDGLTSFQKKVWWVLLIEHEVLD